MSFFLRSFAVSLVVGALAATAACGPGGAANASGRTPLADKWLTRAKAGYRGGDFEDARDAVNAALQAAPKDNEARVLAARLALTRLDYAETLKATEGLDTPEVHGLRGRARWYLGDIEQAADELEAMLRDPTVKDPWARDVAGLARRGAGRHPFQIDGGLVAAVEMPRVGPILIVPCELEGERILAMVATAAGEVIVDSNSRREPAWVNLRFGDRLEVRDVPALTQDLSALTRQFGAPVKALLGVNLLRHLHVTFDRRGDQFIVRKDDPAPSPDASRMPLFYVRGGGMLLRGLVGGKDEGRSLFLVDTSIVYPMALEDDVWRRAGVDPSKLGVEPGLPPGVKAGVVPSIKIGGFDLPRIPAVANAPLQDAKANVDVDLGGVIGAGLLQAFRVTLAEEGRSVWLEPDPSLQEPGEPRRPPPGAEAPAGPGPAAAPSAPPPSAPPKKATPKTGEKK